MRKIFAQGLHKNESLRCLQGFSDFSLTQLGLLATSQDGARASVHVSSKFEVDTFQTHQSLRLYLHRITSVVISELASCHKEFQYPVMKVLRYKQLDTTCFGKSRDACIVTMLNRI